MNITVAGLTALLGLTVASFVVSPWFVIGFVVIFAIIALDDWLS
jgi:hypothetical protein